MPRYIDADALLAEAKRLSGPQTGDGWDNWGVYALIERQPTADVVERDCYDRLLAENDMLRQERPVVHCRDCKHYDCEDGDMKCVRSADWDEATAHYFGFVEYHGPDWYCADGERKEAK